FNMSGSAADGVVVQSEIREELCTNHEDHPAAHGAASPGHGVDPDGGEIDAGRLEPTGLVDRPLEPEEFDVRLDAFVAEIASRCGPVLQGEARAIRGALRCERGCSVEGVEPVSARADGAEGRGRRAVRGEGGTGGRVAGSLSRAGRRTRFMPAIVPGLVLLAVCTAVSCAQRAAPPSADQPPRPVPDLTGQSVMVLPVQTGSLAGRGDAALDSELAFWLEERGAGIRWAFPPALEAALRRSPGLDIRLDALAVASFRRAEVRNIGDPLFGDLRRLGALVDARYALLPVSAEFVPGPDGTGRAELFAAIIDTL